MWISGRRDDEGLASSNEAEMAGSEVLDAVYRAPDGCVGGGIAAAAMVGKGSPRVGTMMGDESGL